MAISSTVRHALPDPCFHPLCATDRHHTLVCKTRAAEQPSHSVRRLSRAASRYAPLLGETRRTGDDYNYYANYIVLRILVFIAPPPPTSKALRVRGGPSSQKMRAREEISAFSGICVRAV